MAGALLLGDADLLDLQLYGIGCGVMTVFLRSCGAWNEGVGFAILFMNLWVWLLDKAVRPTVKRMRLTVKRSEKGAE